MSKSKKNQDAYPSELVSKVVNSIIERKFDREKVKQLKELNIEADMTARDGAKVELESEFERGKLFSHVPHGSSKLNILMIFTSL